MAPKVAYKKKPTKNKPAKKKPIRRKIIAENNPAPKVKKKLPKEGEDNKVKKWHKRKVEIYKNYIFKVFKQVDPDAGIFIKAMVITNNFINDIFEKVAREASKLAQCNKSPTIKACSAHHHLSGVSDCCETHFSKRAGQASCFRSYEGGDQVYQCLN